MSAIGFIGLGNMGFPMAARLADAGHDLIVADRDGTIVETFVAEHPSAKQGDVGGRLWSQVEVVITMLPDSAIVEQVLLGGVVDRTAPGTLFIDMSSSEPLRSRDLSALLKKRGFRYLDAPVPGGVRGAESGQLAIMVGGRQQDLSQARAIFDVLGKAAIHVGVAGSGHAAKALNNLVSAATIAVTVEALRVGEAFGIDPGTLTDVLNASTGRSHTTENKVRQFMLSGSYSSGFPIGLMTKDIRIATSLSEGLGVGSPFSEECKALWEAAVESGHAGDDHTQMYEILGRAVHH
jgi:3-hydroxyisobutyrate dehydrogenase